MELDHLFVFTEPGGGALRERLEAAGLVETYRRRHPGQGTANICYVFDDAFLELLWVVDEAECRAPRTARTGLWERSRWRTDGTCPFGVALRGTKGEAMPFPTWAYGPIYLPAGASLPVATLSDDPRQPLVFQAPGGGPPATWDPERRGAAQRPAYAGVSFILRGPASPALAQLPLRSSWRPTWSAIVELRRPDGRTNDLQLP